MWSLPRPISEVLGFLQLGLSIQVCSLICWRTSEFYANGENGDGKMKTEQEIQRTRNYLIQKHIDKIHRLIHQLDIFLGDLDNETQIHQR